MESYFEWDNKKANVNLSKHQVSFEEAQTVFDDRLSATFPDPDHSINELREITIGWSIKNRLLLVFTTQRANKIRIISARVASKNEKRKFEGSI